MSSTPATHTAGDDAHDHGDHAVSLWILVAVWLTLMVLTVVTVSVTTIDLGRFDLIIAMVIATIKATLVCLFFMHLYWDRPIMGMMFLGCLGFVSLFIIFVVVDTGQYQPAIEARQLDDPVILLNEQSESVAP